MYHDNSSARSRLSNALKFTAKGYVVVHIGRVTESTPECPPTYESVEEQAAKDNDTRQGHAGFEHEEELQISVTDTGIGIPKDKADKLFQTFSQVDASTTRNFGGTGLGLAISRRLSRMMGGDMVSQCCKGVELWIC